MPISDAELESQRFENTQQEMIGLEQSLETHTLCRFDPGNYSGDLDQNMQRCGQGTCEWSDGSSY